jgi:ABC-type transport system involved in multi-copper enzyme maturation permease subunit
MLARESFRSLDATPISPQAILYRGAGIEIVWRSFAVITLIGLIFFAIALLRFRRTVAKPGWLPALRRQLMQ